MSRNFLILGILCIALAMTAVVRGGDGEAAPNDPSEGATFIGEKSCKKCHMKQHRTWKKMKHKKAFESLPAKYQNATEKDEAGRLCISCHVTAFGEKDRGGFADLETSKHLLGVQCEACHGPGSNHKKAGQVVLDAKRKKFNEGEKTFIQLTTTNCSNCHNPHISHKKYAAAGG